MKIAIIGSGISGMTAAHFLKANHDITLFEAGDRIGGHTATKIINYEGREYAIDTGFIVYNDWTYPNFIKLLDKIGVANQPTAMGFSVSHKARNYEYAGENLNTLFCQRKNLVNVRHWQMIFDILRFNKESVRDFEKGAINQTQTLGEYLKVQRYSDAFVHYYLLPMGAAIWSSSVSEMYDFPLYFFVRFCRNHGLLSVNDRPQWRVIEGGSQAYIKPLLGECYDKVELNSKIQSITRQDHKVSITVDGQMREFDHVILACHSDQALALLGDASTKEQEVLGAIGYRNNDVVLHTDSRLLPNSRRAVSSWNYLLDDNYSAPPVLTYHMNTLQSLAAPVDFCVTLNATDRIDPNKILGRYQYSHPVFTKEAMAAQARWLEINGPSNTWFAGAYWFNGFHEDGVKSALRVVEALGEPTF